ncbi:Phosphoesterase HXTX [Reticulomyxa filosa]|uniref:Phosphoesterase HXTX n=1 Tax=Reticulomyxa filosa TaxID=46433 RepID=X6NRB2_RETFI|nr:Phosphoesterase HXTX [Reticulomyxa filosa]|eukprot:ETO28840.1 Phosphoesterase HXTX [Reticulomyxa filosa]
MRKNFFVGIPIRREYSVHWFPKWNQFHKKVRLVHPEDLHVTVAFLGKELGETSLRSICEYLDKMNAFVEPHYFTLTKPILLPNTRQPTAIGYEIGENLQLLQTLIMQHRAQFTKLANIRSDRRTPLPHLTIARPPSLINKNYAECLQSIQQWYENKDGTTFIPGEEYRIRLDEIALYTWADGYPNRTNPSACNFKIIHRKKLISETLQFLN